MPEMDGVETMRIIEEHCRRHGKSCASMFITAYPDDDRAKEITSSGRTRIMPKPFDVDDLLASIQLELQTRPA